MFVQLTKDFLGHPPGQRIDVADEQAQLLMQRGLAEAVPGDPLAPLVNRAADQLTARLSESVNAALRQFADAPSTRRPALFGPTSDAAPKKSFGDWLLHVARNDAPYLEKAYGTVRTKAAMNEASGTGGGYLVPPDFYDGLMRVVAEHTFFRRRAFVQPMAAAALQFPHLDVTTPQAAGVSPFFGGVHMTWTEEAATRSESEPSFKMMELKAHELSGYAVSSNVLLQDAGVGLEKFLLTLFGQAVGWFEEYAFLQGNGVGKPLGVLNSPAALTVTRANANKVQLADVAAMLAKLLPSSQRRAIWVVHPFVLAQLVQLADAGGHVVWLPSSGGAQDGVPGTLFGLPVVTTEKVPALGSRGDCSLIDPHMYVIGDRMQIEIAASEHVNFLMALVGSRKSFVIIEFYKNGEYGQALDQDISDRTILGISLILTISCEESTCSNLIEVAGYLSHPKTATGRYSPPEYSQRRNYHKSHRVNVLPPRPEVDRSKQRASQARGVGQHRRTLQ